MFVTGPDVVKTVTNEVVTQEELGGAKTHTTKTSVADNSFENDIETLLATRDFFDYLPLSNREDVPERPTSDAWDREEPSLDTLIPDNANQPYDMHEIIRKTLDEGDFFEIQPEPRRKYHLRVRSGGRPHGGRGGQPAHGARGRARHQLIEEGRALRALLRCV